MTYNSPGYFVSTYFPLYFQTVRKTEPVQWVECGWVEFQEQWVNGPPCLVTTEPPVRTRSGRGFKSLSDFYQDIIPDNYLENEDEDLALILAALL